MAGEYFSSCPLTSTVTSCPIRKKRRASAAPSPPLFPLPAATKIRALSVNISGHFCSMASLASSAARSISTSCGTPKYCMVFSSARCISPTSTIYSISTSSYPSSIFSIDEPSTFRFRAGKLYPSGLLSHIVTDIPAFHHPSSPESSSTPYTVIPDSRFLSNHSPQRLKSNRFTSSFNSSSSF